MELNQQQQQYFDLARLEEAVVVFYRSTSQEQAITHEWLTKAQASPQAWQFAWQLLQLNKNQEVQFFGAITLHSKLMKYWHEVPPENREELKHKILENIVRFAKGPKIVLNRLCIALSAYMVHMLTEWPTGIEDVINTFQSQQIPNVSSDVHLWIMLEILQAIPEEMTAIYTSVKRVTLRAEISSRAPLVLKTTEEYLELQLGREWSEDTFVTMLRTVKCMNVWIKNVSISIENCYKLTDVLLKIINKCYWPSQHNCDGIMSSDESELAEICIKTLQNIIIQPEAHHFPKSAFVLIKKITDSLCGITKNEWKPGNDNEDIVVNIYSLFVASVERHSQILLAGIGSDNEISALYAQVVNEIIQCTNKPGIYPVEESCSVLAMGFWYLLQDEVFAMRNEIDRIKCWDYIKPLYAHLTRILVHKAEQPDENAIKTWTSDDLETFRCYRQDISDTFMYCFDVLQGYILEILGAVLNGILAELNVNPTNWTKLEACIYSFQSVAEHFGSEQRNSEHISKLLTILSEIPYQKMNEKLLGTALETIGAYCLWLKDNPAFLPQAIELLVCGLHSSMSAQATLGLKELCRDCQLEMKPYAEPLLNACQASLVSSQMKNNDSVRLMYSVGKLMSLLPPEKIPHYLDIIVSPCFEELQTICQNETKTPAARIRTIFRLNMISTLFSSLNTDLDEENQHVENLQTVQPVLIVMQKTMPIFRHIAELWVEELDVLESACSALKHAIVNLNSSFKPMLQDLCYFIVAIFQTRCCAPTLEISKTAIIIFYRDEGCKALMQQLLVEFVLHSFKLFESTAENLFSSISDTIEMFYACLMQIVKKIPQSLDDKAIDYEKLIYFALKAMTLPENGPIRTSTQFLTHFIMQSRNFVGMTQAVHTAGEDIIRTVILCVGCVTPRQQIDKYADILLATNKKYPTELVTWLKNVMALQNFPTPLVDEAEKTRFISQIIREKVNKRLLQKHLNDFAIRARGLSDKFH